MSERLPGTDYPSTKGAIKQDVGLGHVGHLTKFMTLTDGKTTDIEVGRVLRLRKGRLVACDRGYTDFGWCNQLTLRRIIFVTRLKPNARYCFIARHKVSSKQVLRSDQITKSTGIKNRKQAQILLRWIGYCDIETAKHHVILINNYVINNKTIADIYKQRRQIELFFSCVKQILKIKSIVGISKNVVMAQYLLLLQINLFEIRDLYTLHLGDLPDENRVNTNQLAFL